MPRSWLQCLNLVAEFVEPVGSAGCLGFFVALMRRATFTALVFAREDRPNFSGLLATEGCRELRYGRDSVRTYVASDCA